LATVAIVLDFVNPVLSLWRLIDQGRKLWLDESEAGGYTEHRVAYRRSPDGGLPGLLPLKRREIDDGRETTINA
jgi:hypothetical protein